MTKRDLVVNIRVSPDFIKRMDAHIDSINQADKLGRKLDRSTFIRALVDGEIAKEDSHGR